MFVSNFGSCYWVLFEVSLSFLFGFIWVSEFESKGVKSWRLICQIVEFWGWYDKNQNKCFSFDAF